jgi:hypothetical protein
MPNKSNPHGIIICIPVFNGWQPVSTLLLILADTLRDGADLRFILATDGSTQTADALTRDLGKDGSIRFEIKRLSTNLRHERAKATGLAASIRKTIAKQSMPLTGMVRLRLSMCRS